MAKKHAPKGPIKARNAVDPMSGSHPMSVPCTAHSKQTGKPCGRTAIPGGTVCRYHGGAAPQVQAAAHDRLMALQFPALNALDWLVNQRDFPSATLGAVKDVLDRTEGRPTEKVDMNVSGQIDVVEILRQRHERHRNG